MRAVRRSPGLSTDGWFVGTQALPRPILASTSMEPGTKIQIEQPGYRNHQELTEMTRFGGGGVSCGSPSISSQLSNVNGVF